MGSCEGGRLFGSHSSVVRTPATQAREIWFNSWLAVPKQHPFLYEKGCLMVEAAATMKMPFNPLYAS